MRGVLAFLILAAVGILPAAAAERPPGLIRIATFNCSLNRASAGELRRDLATPDNAQARAVAEIIQRVRPDILLLQEFDYDAGGESLRAFQANYLARSQNGAAPHRVRATPSSPSPTPAVPSGFDLDNDGRVQRRRRRAGLRRVSGAVRHGAAVALSDRCANARARSANSCGATCRARCCPTIRHPACDWYSPEELAVLPLSSKSHWDVPVRIGRRHAAPARESSDAARLRRRRRSQWQAQSRRDPLLERLSDEGAAYIRDDARQTRRFQGQGVHHHGRPEFRSRGWRQPERRDRRAARASARRLASSCRRAPAAPRPARRRAAPMPRNAATRAPTPPTSTTASPATCASTIYCRRRACTVCGGGVFWPAQADPAAALVWGDRPAPSSDHRLVWLDVTADGARCPPGSDPTASAPSHPASLKTTRTKDFFSTLFARSRPSRMVSMYSRYSLSVVQGVNFSRAGDVGELRGRRLAVVDLGIDVELPPFGVARRALLDREPAIEIAEHAESPAGVGLAFDPRFERRHLLRQQIAVAPGRGQRTGRATRLQVHGHQPEFVAPCPGRT